VHQVGKQGYIRLHSVAVFPDLKQKLIQARCSRKSAISIIAERTLHLLIKARVALHTLGTESWLSAH